MSMVQTELYNPVTGMRLRETSDPQAGSDAELVWEAMYPPHSPEPPPHFHPWQNERMEILSGSLCSRVNGIVHELWPGETLEIPAGTPHSMWNPAAKAATSIWRTTPARHRRELFTRLYDLAQKGRTNDQGVPNLLQVAVLESAYPDEIRLAHPPLFVQRVVFAVLASLGRLLGYRAS